MEHAAAKDYVKIPKQEYNLLKEVYRTVKRDFRRSLGWGNRVHPCNPCQK
jgi:hypothetical protein